MVIFKRAKFFFGFFARSIKEPAQEAYSLSRKMPLGLMISTQLILHTHCVTQMSLIHILKKINS